MFRDLCDVLLARKELNQEHKRSGALVVQLPNAYKHISGWKNLAQGSLAEHRAFVSALGAKLLDFKSKALTDSEFGKLIDLFLQLSPSRVVDKLCGFFVEILFC